jgi:hypothetical protein
MAGSSPPPGPVPIAELMRGLASVAESRAAFTEVKSLSALTVPLTSSGTLYYRRPSYFEKDTMTPAQERLVVDGSRLTLIEGSDSPRVIELGSEPALRAVIDAIRGTLSGDATLLSRSYRLDVAGGLGSWQLTLTPIEAPVAALVRQVVVQGNGTAVRAVRTIQANGDESRMTLAP